MHEELRRLADNIIHETKKRRRSDMFETLAMAAAAGLLAYFAYGTAAHSILFAFVGYSISAVGNRISDQIQLVIYKLKVNSLISDIIDNGEQPFKDTSNE